MKQSLVMSAFKVKGIAALNELIRATLRGVGNPHSSIELRREARQGEA